MTGMLIRKVATVVTILFLVSTSAFACSFVYNGPYPEVSRNLTIVVRFEGKPLAGASVKLWLPSTESSKSLSMSTAADGTARFTDLTPGKYNIFVRHLDIFASSADGVQGYIEVLPHGTAQAKANLEYRWGEMPIEVRQIAGTMTTSESGANVVRQIWKAFGFSFAVDEAQIELQHATNGSVFKTKSDASGKFVIAGVPSGTYRLHLSGGRYGGSGHWVVRVTPAAANGSLRATATFICGSGYDLAPVR
jgi:hypothetical protein